MFIIQVKYDELLRRCQQVSEEPSHKAVQTSNSPFASSRIHRRLSNSAAPSDLTPVLEDGQQPEYKALFNEIFTCIQKTKEDLSEHRRPAKDSDSQDSAKWTYYALSWDLHSFWVWQERKRNFSLGCFGISTGYRCIKYIQSLYYHTCCNPLMSCHSNAPMLLLVSIVHFIPSLCKIKCYKTCYRKINNAFQSSATNTAAGKDIFYRGLIYG